MGSSLPSILTEVTSGLSIPSWMIQSRVRSPLLQTGRSSPQSEGPTRQTLYAINPDGTEFWNFKGAATSIAGVAIGLEGVIAFTDANGGVYLLNSLGALQWSVDNTNGIVSPPIFGEDGTIYHGSNSEFAALNLEDGSLKWEVALNTRAPAVTGNDGTIYVPVAVTAGDGGIAALNPDDGSELWKFQAGDRVTTSPLVGLDGTIYFGSHTDQLIAINPNGTLKWAFDVGGDVVSSPTMAENGTIYFGSNDSMLYALNTASPGVAASSWPKAQRDVRNTGRFGSDTARRRFFAPHSYALPSLGLGNAVLKMRHTGGLAASPAGTGTTANFRVDVRDRDGSLLFSIDESIEPGATRDIDLLGPGNPDYQGSVVVDASIKDGLVLAPLPDVGPGSGFQRASAHRGVFLRCHGGGSAPSCACRSKRQQWAGYRRSEHWRR